MKNRTCKYATTCKFDHPTLGEYVAKVVVMDATNEDNNNMDLGIAWLIKKWRDLPYLMKEIWKSGNRKITD